MATGETLVAPGTIRCTLAVPADAYIGSYTVYLRNPGGEWVYKIECLHRHGADTDCHGDSPGSGACGETLANVMIAAGAGFSRGAQIILYHEQHPAWFDATDEIWVSPTQIRCTLAIPPGALPGLYAAKVVNPGGAQSSSLPRQGL